jgi:hypothetical protein
VERDREDARVVDEQLLDAVAVMDVEVEVQDAKRVAPGPRDRERRVVVDAEPAGVVCHRVVEAAARVERVLHVAAKDGLHRPERSAGDRRGGLVHPPECGVVATLADPGLAGTERIHGEPPHDLDVATGVAEPQVLVGGGLGREPRLRPERAEQVDAGAEAARRERVLRAEVVGRGAWPVHEQRTAVLSFHRAAMVTRCDAGPRGAGARAVRSAYHPRVGDLLLVLVVILALVLLWRGPKTLPKIGEALGRGVREARQQATHVGEDPPDPAPAPDGDRRT